MDTKKPVASDRLGDGGNQFIAYSTLSIVVHLILLNMVAISLLLLEANQYLVDIVEEIDIPSAHHNLSVVILAG